MRFILSTIITLAALVTAVTQSYAQNPYLPLWEHIPDGEPRVFEDPDNPGKFRAYIIGSHDLRFGSYCGPDIRMWSAPVEDLSAWVDEGPIFTYEIDGQWDVMYAPDLVEVRRRDGKKEYWLYPHSRGANREPMVAKGDRPDGPFTPVNMWWPEVHSVSTRACMWSRSRTDAIPTTGSASGPTVSGVSRGRWPLSSTRIRCIP